MPKTFLELFPLFNAEVADHPVAVKHELESMPGASEYSTTRALRMAYDFTPARFADTGLSPISFIVHPPVGRTSRAGKFNHHLLRVPVFNHGCMTIFTLDWHLSSPLSWSGALPQEVARAASLSALPLLPKYDFGDFSFGHPQCKLNLQTRGSYPLVSA